MSSDTQRGAAGPESDEDLQLSGFGFFLLAFVDFLVFMGVSLEARTDGRQWVLRYFGRQSDRKKQRIEIFKIWCRFFFMVVPIGGASTGWLVFMMTGRGGRPYGVEGLNLWGTIGISCAGYAATVCLLLIPMMRLPPPQE
mgnify:CR=1 FL=1